MRAHCTVHALDHLARVLQLLEVNLSPLGGLLQGEHDVLLAEVDDLLQLGVAEALPVPLPDALLRLPHALTEQSLGGDAFLSRCGKTYTFQNQMREKLFAFCNFFILCYCAKARIVVVFKKKKDSKYLFINYVGAVRYREERYMPDSHANLKTMKSTDQLIVAALFS